MPKFTGLHLICLLHASLLFAAPLPCFASLQRPTTITKATMIDVMRFDSPASAQAFSAMDDRVMGGISRSRMRFDPAGHAVFEGTVSLEQNGGFASVRAAMSPPGGEPVGAIRLEVMGDGKRYKLALRLDGSFDGVSYQAAFDTRAGEWMIIDLPLAAFIPGFRGRQVAAPPLNWQAVRQVGLLISDKQTGPFALALRRISVLPAKATESSPPRG